MLNIPSAFLVCLLPSAGPAITPPPLFLSTTTPVFGPAVRFFFQFCSLAVIWPRRLNSLEPISMEKRLSPTTHNLASKLHKRSVFWLAPTIKCTWWLARSNAMGVVKSFKRSHYNQEVISFQNYYLQLKFTDSRSSKYTLGKKLREAWNLSLRFTYLFNCRKKRGLLSKY